MGKLATFEIERASVQGEAVEAPRETAEWEKLKALFLKKNPFEAPILRRRRDADGADQAQANHVRQRAQETPFWIELVSDTARKLHRRTDVPGHQGSTRRRRRLSRGAEIRAAFIISVGSQTAAPHWMSIATRNTQQVGGAHDLLLTVVSVARGNLPVRTWARGHGCTALEQSSMPELKASVAADLPMNEMFETRRPSATRMRARRELSALDGRATAGRTGERAHEMFLRMGVTFNVYGNEDGSERIFPFDPVPRIIPAEVWAGIEAGLIQRVRALNAFMADIYGEGSILKDDVVPRDLIVGSPQFRHAAVGIKLPHNTFVTVAGIDLVRGSDGRFMVLEDNVRTPSGVSYVIQNRVIMTRLMPELIRTLKVRSVEQYPADLLASLRELSPSASSDPTVAVLTPGPFNSAFFEHVFLSQQMGVDLVEGQDLVCVDHKLFMKTVYGLRQIDVLYRRVDDDFLDPVVFQPDSLLGVPGLTSVLRAGNAVVANAVGTGIADDKAVFAYTPRMIKYYLNEEPIIPIVETHLLRDPEVCEFVLRDLERYRDQADRGLGRLWRGDRTEGQRAGASRDPSANRA